MNSYRLFSWEHSYFSGKTRAYFRYKQRMGSLAPGYEDILATSDLIRGVLLPRSGSGAVPQLEAPDGTWIQDSSEIIDYCEAKHPEVPIVPAPEQSPIQALANYLIELLADEWMVVPGFWERWHFSKEGVAPNHRGFNEQQWGAVLAPSEPGKARRAAGALFFEHAFGISDTEIEPKGVYAGLVHLGVDPNTEPAWQASQHNLLGLLEAHFESHDYVFGGLPSLADFALLAPLYAHLYRDAVAGFALRTHFPLVCEWVERTNGEGALNARMYGQKLYSLNDDGEMVGRPATSHGGAWLPDDEIPETLMPILAVFFEEMWPVLRDAIDVLKAFIESDAHQPGGELPGKTFTATPGFEAHQTNRGALTHAYQIDGISGRRMVVPYQIWMLQRLEKIVEAAVSDPSNRGAVGTFLERFESGAQLLELKNRLAGCRVRKQDARLYSVD